MLFDLHNDYITASHSEQNRININSAYVHDIIYAIWTSGRTLSEDELSLKINQIMRLSSNHKQNNLLYAIEDLSNIDMSSYDCFFATFKPSYVSLTWNGDTALGGGTGGNSRLTGQGMRALRTMERNGIVVDLAHANDMTFCDICDCYSGKVIISHTACRSLCSVMRNSTAIQMKEVARRGGLIGIYAVAHFLSDDNDCSINEYGQHIVQAVSDVGIDYVAIGSDFCGTDNYPKQFCGYGDVPHLEQLLSMHGMNSNEIKKILYKNAHKFFLS